MKPYYLQNMKEYKKLMNKTTNLKYQEQNFELPDGSYSISNI